MTPISIYVHVPFCTFKCGYCDFNAYAGMDALKDEYGMAMVADVHANAPLLKGRTVATVAFGGGTPGEVPAAHIAAVLDAIRATVAVAPDAEVSLEANPATSDGPHLRALRDAGVTRVSFGVQSFDVKELKFLDRLHSPAAASVSIANARAAGIASVGLDLIYGLPGQSLVAWEKSLRRAVDLSPDHISTYALTIEEGTPLGRRVRDGRVTPLDGDSVADMYERAGEVLAAAGFAQYELSNWAKPGHQSRHNSVYWTDGEYVAIGAGAHGYVGGERYENIAHPRDYIRAVMSAEGRDTRPALLNSYAPDERTAMFDWVMLRLRLIDGFAAETFETRFGLPLRAVFGAPLELACAAGVLEMESRVRLTPRGRLLHGALAAQLLAHVS
jgi:oxygen-independent coproporphyrinogen III oxidase